MSHLVIMAAGTGGHVIPGLAVAREMQARGWTVSWLGTTHGMENRLVPPSGIAMDNIAFSGLRGKGLLHTLTGGLRLLGAFWSCLRILRRRSASAVLGMGGYVCFPGGMMAALLGKPLVLVNADAALLLSNRALLPVADRVAIGFDGDAHLATVRGAYAQAEVQAELLPFIDDMPNRLADCDLVVCRAGAVTVSELCAAGVASVLVPLVVSTTSHQRDNAEYMAARGAAIHLPQADLSPQRLAELLRGLTRPALLAMAGKARALARPHAAVRVADEIQRLVPA